MFCLRIAAGLILSFAAAISTFASQNTCLGRSIPVNIFSRDGGPVPPLTTANFEASYRGKAVRINSVTTDQDPRRIVLLLDTSSSVLSDYNRDWTLVLDVADDMLARMPQTAEIGLALFSQTLDTTIKPTNDRKILKAELENLRAIRADIEKKDRWTALWDAIRDTVGLFGSPQMGDSIFVITDGEDNKSKTRPEEATQRLLAAGVRLFTLATIDRFAGGSPTEIEGREALLQIVKATGGFEFIRPRPLPPPFANQQYFTVDMFGNRSTIRAAMISEYQRILFFYRINVTLPEVVDKSQGWKLALTDSIKSTKKNLRLIYPKRLAPCN
jgi:hypothetical protein